MPWSVIATTQKGQVSLFTLTISCIHCCWAQQGKKQSRLQELMKTDQFCSPGPWKWGQCGLDTRDLLPACRQGSQAVLCQFILALNPGIGSQRILKYKVPKHLHPGVVLWQVIVVLGRNLPHLWKGVGQDHTLAGTLPHAVRARTRTHTHTKHQGGHVPQAQCTTSETTNFLSQEVKVGPL